MYIRGMDTNADIFKIETNHVVPSRGKVLISEPFLYDEMFGRSVILLVDHSTDGTMGLVLNKPLPLSLNDVLKEFKDINNIPIYKGGPLSTDTLFYLHTLKDVEDSLQIGKGVYLNGDFDAIRRYILAGNDITAVAGILNGTTNFILNKMIRDKMSFSDALTLAQEKGYAERNPAADVEGHDACRKICILSSLIFGRHVYPEHVYTKGIETITLEDVELANTFDCAIKLIAQVKRLENGDILPTVMPMLVPSSNLLHHVNGVFNAVMVWGDGFDQIMFYGRGAGKLPTASAVLGDIIDSVKANGTVTAQSWVSVSDNNFVEGMEAFSAPWCFRTSACNAEQFQQAATACDVTVEQTAANGCIIAACSTSQADQFAVELQKNGATILSQIPVLAN